MIEKSVRWMGLIKQGLKLSPRIVSSPWREKPDFLVIGAQKSGTTTLSRYLEYHPGIQTGLKLEVHYFDGGLNPLFDRYKLGESLYRAYFPYGSGNNGNNLFFEKTPEYIFHPKAAERIKKTLGGIKMIAILRNPVERAISHYFHERRKGRENLGIYDAMKAEESRIKEILKRSNYSSKPFIHYTYKKRGIYVEQLERYWELFERDKILILNSRELFENPTSTMSKVYDFLSVKDVSSRLPEYRKNVGRNKREVPEKVLGYLGSFFKKHNEALYNELGRVFEW